MPIVSLSDRAVLSVEGDDAESFLAGIVTCAVDGAPAHFGALLTPQGKIIVDFLLARRQDGHPGYLIDVPAGLADALLKRLTMYRLRAKVTLADRSGELGVAAGFGASPQMPAGAAVFADPRLADLGWRCIAPKAALAGLADAPADAYEAHRIGVAVPQGGRDFAYGDAFPHEAAMDQLGGVDFEKGCYVGQEVVSRTQHRGLARTRVAALSFAGPAPAEGAEIRAGDKPIGRVGSVAAAQGRAIGLLRLDRLAAALAAGHPLLAGEARLLAAKPGWAGYAFPELAVQESPGARA